MIEFLTNIYIFPLIGVLLGLFVYHFYHKIDEKNYLTKGDYFKCALLTYLVCFTILFLQQNIISSGSTSSLITNSGTVIPDVSSVLEDVDNVFNTGHPEF